MTFSQIAKRKLKVAFASLSGPSFAHELKAKKPTVCVVASHDENFSKFLAERISTPYLRLYAHRDPIGVEACGALKNIMAIACGISDGMKLGQNARAALLSRGLFEMTKLVNALQGNQLTCFGLAGVGDLLLTATGNKSRNRRLGLLIAAGHRAQKAHITINQPIEGFYTVKQVERIRIRFKLDLPICKKVYEICYKNQSPRLAILDLMNRHIKVEESSSWKLRRTSAASG